MSTSLAIPWEKTSLVGINVWSGFGKIGGGFWHCLDSSEIKISSVLEISKSGMNDSPANPPYKVSRMSVYFSPSLPIFQFCLGFMM